MIIKILSLNIWNGGQLLPAPVDFIKQTNPELVALQEVFNASGNIPDQYRTMEVLTQKLNYPYYDYAQAFIKDFNVGLIPEGNAVFSRYPIRTAKSTYIATGSKSTYTDSLENWPILPRVLQHVVIDVGTEINLFNFHGVWDLDGDCYSSARRAMIKRILNEINGLKNVVLTGDTNAKSTSPAMQDIEKALKPVFGHELVTTFNLKRKTDPGYATAAVDLMYVSDDIKVVSKDVPEVDISDHLPVLVELEVY